MQPQHYQEVIIFFIAANIIVVGFAVFFFYILRIQQKRKQLYQKQLVDKEFKTREEAFLQISRDLHDDIGSSLSGINMLSQLARQQLPQTGNDATHELLQKVNVYTNEVIDKVSDMAWLLKPSAESLYLLIRKLKSYSLPAAATCNIQVHFNISPAVLEKELSIQQRKAVYLISKEAINNAIKYGACQNIYYDMKSITGRLTLMIRDDGKGFSVNNSAGNGLKNMQARAEEINAVLTIHSGNAQGTTIGLVL